MSNANLHTRGLAAGSAVFSGASLERMSLPLAGEMRTRARAAGAAEPDCADCAIAAAASGEFKCRTRPPTDRYIDIAAKTPNIAAAIAVLMGASLVSSCSRKTSPPGRFCFFCFTLAACERAQQTHARR